MIKEASIEFKAYEKLSIPKQLIIEMLPDTGKALDNLNSYVDWLATRYKRAALPTEFNNRIKAIDPKDKRKKIAKENNTNLSGIYIELNPDTELSADQSYNVNLLGVVMSDFNGGMAKVEAALDEYAQVMRQAGMDVACKLLKESDISMATIRRFKRFYYDDLSFKEVTAPFAVEV